LKYIRATSATGSNPGDWGPALTLDAGAQVGWFSSLAEVDGKPAISYFDYTNGDVKFIQASSSTGCEPEDWYSPGIVDRQGTVGQPTSQAVVNGNPAICYQDDSAGSLKYAYFTP
jgi:hypothetical protein